MQFVYKKDMDAIQWLTLRTNRQQYRPQLLTLGIDWSHQVEAQQTVDILNYS